MDDRESSKGTRRSPPLSRRGAVVVLGAVFALVLWGGYSHHWSWTGINGATATLWDWLHLLLLPLAVAVLPIWLSRKTRVPRRYKSLSAGALAVFAVVVLAGYTIPWAWTGFVGNSLWDWLNLIALPLAVALMPVYGELRARWTARHSAVTAAGLVAFIAIVLAGYLGSWTWTGFTGNTLWDWLHLLLVPLLLPTIVVPLMVPMATSRVQFLEPPKPREPPEPEVVAEPPAPGQSPGSEPGHLHLGQADRIA
jgi:hypothetical protein